MDSKVEVYLRRARTEVDSASLLFEASSRNEVKTFFNLDEGATFFSGVISHA